MGSTYDLVTLGRSNMDLFSQDVGADFEDISGFDAMVGGSPANIAMGVSRLGLRSAMLTAIGDDRVGDFVVRYMSDEGVDLSYAPRIPGKLTSLALLGVQPPSHFPLSFYREDPADIYLDDVAVKAFPWSDVSGLQVSGNAVSRGPCATAALSAAALALDEGKPVYVDLDLRPSEWRAPTDFGDAMRDLLGKSTSVIGTEEEFYAALMSDPEPIMDGDSVPKSELSSLDEEIHRSLSVRNIHTAVVKRGGRGATIMTSAGDIDVPGFSVDPVNTVGAGDSFAAGLISRLLLGWEWPRATRFANACGALVVTRHGCSAAFPYQAEVEEFIEERGGL